MNILDIKNASLKIDKKLIFEKISIVSNAKIIGICGANGVGKSSFLLQMMGVNTFADKFVVLDQDILKNPKNSKISIVFQDAKSTINPMFELGKYIEFLAKDKNIKNAKEKTMELCETFKLKDIWHSYAYELSGGESKKLSLIFALLCNPKLLILDELNAGLDEKSIKIMIDFLMMLDLNIVLSSHDKRFLDFCDELYEFKGDEIVAIRN